MSLDDQLADLLARYADLFATLEDRQNAEILLLAGTVNDPNSFNETGGKVPPLGYYPIVNVNGQTMYFPCQARLKAIALGGENGATLEALDARLSAAQTVVDAGATILAAVPAAQTAQAGSEASAQRSEIAAVGNTKRLDALSPTGFDAETTGWLMPFTDATPQFPKIFGGVMSDERWHWLLASVFTTLQAQSVSAEVMKPAIITVDGYDLSGWNFAITAGDAVFAGERADGTMFFADDPKHVVYEAPIAGKQQIFSQRKGDGRTVQVSPAGSNNTSPRIESGRVIYKTDRVTTAPGGLLSAPLNGGTERAYVSRKSLAGWGDSQLSNTGGPMILTQLVADLLGWPAYIGGVPSQTSADIAARQGGNPAKVTVTGNQIPGAGSVAVTARSANPITGFSPTQTGTFFAPDGTPLTLTRDNSNNYTLARAVAGDPIAWPADTPLVPDSDQYRDWTSLIRVGRNDGGQSTTALLNTIKIVEWLAARGNRFVVLGQLYGPDNGVVAGTRIDDNLRQRFPDNFFSTMPALLAAGNGSAQDNADIAAGLVPTSLRFDTVTHLNNAGKQVEAPAIANFIISKGWNL